MAFLYVVLVIGAITTLYPFFLMVSTGLKGPTDQNDNRLVPAYFQVEAELLAKYLDDKYAGDRTMIDSTRIGATATAEEVEKYEKFLTDLPTDFWTPAFKMAPNQVTSRLNARYQGWLRDRYKNDIEKLNKTYIEENVAFQTVTPPAEMFERRTWNPPSTPKYTEWLQFKEQLPAEFRLPIRTQRLYQEYVRAKYQNTFSNVPEGVAGGAKKFEELGVPPPDSDGSIVYSEFYRQLPERYRNGAAETFWGKWDMPIAAFEAKVVQENAGPIRREFAGRNYSYVLDYILLNGRAVWTTSS